MFKLFKNRCYNGGQQHKFQERYDRKFPRNVNIKSPDGYVFAEDQSAIIESFKEEIYVKDVCVWCGKEIKK